MSHECTSTSNDSGSAISAAGDAAQQEYVTDEVAQIKQQAEATHDQSLGKIAEAWANAQH